MQKSDFTTFLEALESQPSNPTTAFWSHNLSYCIPSVYAEKNGKHEPFLSSELLSNLEKIYFGFYHNSFIIYLLTDN